MAHYFNAALLKVYVEHWMVVLKEAHVPMLTAAAQNMWTDSVIKRVNYGHTIILGLYIYMYISI